MFVACLAIIITLIVVVGLHEVGHALMARLFGVKIKKVSIGFGPPVMRKISNNGCEWRWGTWPLGGYVELLNSRISPVAKHEYSACFDKKPIISRILILLGGVLANLLTAWVAFVVVFYIGMMQRVPQIEFVQPNSMAAQAGVLPGDQFTAINHYPISSWQDVSMELVMFWGKKDISVTFARPNEKGLKELTFNLSQMPLTGQEHSLLKSIGVTPNMSIVQKVICFPTLLTAIQHVNQLIGHMISFFMSVVYQLFNRTIPLTILLGPIGIFTASVASLMQGVTVFIYFIASFSLAVAVVNLFPLPGLDGCSILYSIIEKIRGKPSSLALEVLLHRLMFIIFCIILVQLLMNDLMRLAT